MAKTVKIDIFSDYITEISSEKGGSELLLKVKEIEALLGNAEVSNNRIAYLDVLRVIASQFPEIGNLILNDPLTTEQYTKCVEKGLARVYQDGDVTFEQVARLAHNRDGLSSFTDMLVAIPEARRAKCWRKAMVIPFKAPTVNLARIMPMSANETNWQQIASLTAEWMEALAPSKTIPALGYRGTVAGKSEFSLKLNLSHGAIISKHMTSLSEIADDIEDQKVASIWERIPWKRIKDFISEDVSWETFLKKVGMAFITDLKYEDLKMLQDWVPKGVKALPQYRSEIKLLEILVKSTDMVKS
jgi:hypothetical protein